MSPHLLEKDTLVRANVGLMLSLVWGALAACVIAALGYDIARLFW